MRVLGISPLDKDATASLVEDGRVVFAAAEERFSRKKQHAGFPRLAIESLMEQTSTQPEDIDAVAYPFLEWHREVELIEACGMADAQFQREFDQGTIAADLRRARSRVSVRTEPVHGLASANQRVRKGFLKELFYRYAGVGPALSGLMARRAFRQWAAQAAADHRRLQSELERGLEDLGLGGRLRRFEHHLSHAANSYLTSGFDRALIVTLDGYGTGLAGSISVGEGGKIRRLRDLRFPYSLGTLYETVTSSLGFNPDRHAGKVVGLAAYGDPDLLGEVLLNRFDMSDPSGFRIFENLNVYFSRHLAAEFPMVDVAGAYQHALEVVAIGLVEHWVRETGCDSVVLSGGVTANVKMNQRIHQCQGVRNVFVYPNMGDGGCGTGIALNMTWPGGVGQSLEHAYLGPEFSRQEIEKALGDAGLDFSRPSNLAAEVARRVHEGNVVARFSGRMEYGPRALGNRSILYHAREPEVNQWLNKRLGRTEFMPFAPVTLWESREKSYLGLSGAEEAAQFMTITFDCTDWMKQMCPAAVHVDGTARPQLIKRSVNPEYYDILTEYERLSGISSLINTSFNMHEEPIVCTPADAVRAFLAGKLDGMAIGPFYVPSPTSKATPVRSAH